MEVPILNRIPVFPFFITLESEQELKSIWDRLVVDGKIMMELKDYAWSPLYGWLEDQYGVCWQLSLGKISEVGKSIVPFLMFCDQQQGNAAEAIAFYQGLMSPQQEPFIVHYAPEQVHINATVVHSRFYIGKNLFMAMDGGVPQPFNFDEGVSFAIHCQNQEEVDYYWDKITAKGTESVCGWCKDQFGISWQIVPVQIYEILKDPERRENFFRIMTKMKKLIISDLEKA
ncbi:MAG: hypothetical protein DI598_18360 [Pseudopedobacter saltans]|uniref:PhnB-like domain-containing protein n=1 Tax=Pseudopedobacter saltans TaxID=151895 RepID=A0A2W5G739_9SPHI|nr:MAG: hypothetical protein DI598_18360 [Pseudopedobacter saltans]